MFPLLITLSLGYSLYREESSIVTTAELNTSLPAFVVIGNESEVMKVEIWLKYSYVSVPSDFYEYVLIGKGYMDSYMVLQSNVSVMNTFLNRLTHYGKHYSKDQILLKFDPLSGSGGIQQIDMSIQINEAVLIEDPWYERAFIWVAVVILSLCSACFSGLNISLLSIDILTLDVMIQSGNDDQKEQARAIKKVRENENLIICTDLFGNTLVNSTLSILLSQILDPVTGFIFSATIITMVGEILPQTFMYKYQVESSYYLLWYIKLFRALLFFVAYPLSKFIEFLLGTNAPHQLTANELTGFLQKQIEQKEFNVDKAQKNIADGALHLPEMLLSSVMKPVINMFYVKWDDVIDQEFIFKVMDSGFSRIPIINKDGDVEWILITKYLIYIDPNRGFTVEQVHQFIGRTPMKLQSNDNLYNALTMFLKNHTHIAVVEELVDSPTGGDPIIKVVGIITLDDVLKIMFKAEKQKIPKAHPTPCAEQLYLLFNEQEVQPETIDWLVYKLLIDREIPRDGSIIAHVSDSMRFAQKAQRGDVLLNAGQVPEHLYIVFRGSVIYKDPNSELSSRPVSFSVFGTVKKNSQAPQSEVTIVVNSEDCHFLRIPQNLIIELEKRQ